MATIPIPTGFYITAGERGLAERIHEEIPSHTRYTPPSFAELERITNRIKARRDAVIANGKCAEEEGEQWKADEARHDLEEIDYALEQMRARWKACGGMMLSKSA